MNEMGPVFYNDATQEYSIYGWVVTAEQLHRIPREQMLALLEGRYDREDVWRIFSAHGIVTGAQPGALHWENNQAAIRHLVSMGRAVLA